MVIQACPSEINVRIFVFLKRATHCRRQQFPVGPRRASVVSYLKALCNFYAKTGFTRQIFYPELFGLFCEVERSGVRPVDVRVDVLLVELSVVEMARVQEQLFHSV